MDCKRVLIKISGEMISGSNGSKFDFDAISKLCHNIKNVVDSNIDVSLVVGGGNVIRGRDFQDSNIIKQETADSVGMLSTVINGILLRDALRGIGINSELVSGLRLPFDILRNDPFNISKLTDEKKVIIFVGGTGLPYFSTDTVSVIAAFMSNCDAILKATKTDGVYDKDPYKFNDAVHISNLTYKDAIGKGLEVMDKTAFALASQRNIPIYVFSAKEDNCFVRVIKSEIKHSVVR